MDAKEPALPPPRRDAHSGASRQRDVWQKGGF